MMPSIPGAYKGRFESQLRGYKKSDQKTFGRKVSVNYENQRMNTHGNISPKSPRNIGGGGSGTRVLDKSYLKI